MTSKFLLAGLTAGLLLGASAGAMAADAPKPPKLTPAVQKNLAAAQTAGNKKDYPAAAAAIDEAKKVSSRTPYDDLMINRIATSFFFGLLDMAAAEVDADAAADIDPAQIPDADKGAVYRTAMLLSLNDKHYDKAAKYAKLYQATNPPASDRGEITQALFFGGDYAGAVALAQQDVDAATAAGQKPPRNALDIIMNAQVKQKAEAGAEKTLEQIVANYNTPDDWKQLLGVSLTTKGMRDIDYVYVGRLMLLQGQIGQSDANLVGSAANSNRLGLYGDAEAMAKFGGPTPDPRAAADKKSMPAQIAAAAKNAGEYDVKTAEAAYGYGMYSDAENLARMAKTKGGAKDPTEPDMVLGMALTAEGKYAEAGLGC